MRRALAIALWALVACTNDFDKFDPPEGFEPVPPDPSSGSGETGGSLSVGSGAGTSTGSTNSSTGASQGGAGQGGAGQGGVPTECVVEDRCASDTQQCGEECGQDSADCQADCPSGNPGIECKADCVMFEETCREFCVQMCLFCDNLDEACGDGPCETLAGI